MAIPPRPPTRPHTNRGPRVRVASRLALDAGRDGDRLDDEPLTLEARS